MNIKYRTLIGCTRIAWEIWNAEGTRVLSNGTAANRKKAGKAAAHAYRMLNKTQRRNAR